MERADVMTSIRAIQFVGVLAIGMLTALACIGNLTDYGSNFALVQHVLSMDTTFSDSSLRWRAIQSPALHHLAYWLIIAAEGLAGASAWSEPGIYCGTETRTRMTSTRARTWLCGA
jgi:predicted small integral membrane protein